MGYLCLSVSFAPRDLPLIAVGGAVADFGQSLVEFAHRFERELRVEECGADLELLAAAEALFIVADDCSPAVRVELKLAQERDIPVVLCLPASRSVPREIRQTPVVAEVFRWSTIESAHDFVRALLAQYRSPLDPPAETVERDADDELYCLERRPSVH